MRIIVKAICRASNWFTEGRKQVLKKGRGVNKDYADFRRLQGKENEDSMSHSLLSVGL
jgi:hypothetical protein